MGARPRNANRSWPLVALISGVAAIVLLTLTLLGIGIVQAGPFVPPAGAPAINTPTPPVPPAIGSPFPPDPTAVVPSGVAVPVSTIWLVDICRIAGPVPGVGIWTINGVVVPPLTGIVIGDGLGADHIRFRLCPNFVPAIGPPPPFWKLVLEFAANPWAPGSTVRIPLSSISPLFTAQAIPTIPTPPVGSYAFNIVLTDGQDVVLDFLDPVLVVGSDLDPTVPDKPVVAVGGATSYLDAGSGTSTGAWAALGGGVAAVMSVIMAGGWFARRLWLGPRS